MGWRALPLTSAAPENVAVTDEELVAARNVTRSWNGLDEQGRRVSSGVYFYRLDTPGFSDTKKMVLMQ